MASFQFDITFRKNIDWVTLKFSYVRDRQPGEVRRI